MKKIIGLLTCFTFMLVLVACSKDAGQIVNGYMELGNLKWEQIQLPKVGEEIAIIKTNMGEFRMRFFPDVAPKAVENFISLSKEGFYDGLPFSRVENDFLIQIGFHEDYPEGKSIFGEFYEDECDLELRHITGAVGMAKRELNKNSSQFYIINQNGLDEDYLQVMRDMDEDAYPKELVNAFEVLGGVPRLDLKFTIFAQVFYGMDIVKQINEVEIDPITKIPLEDVIIENIEIVKYEGK